MSLPAGKLLFGSPELGRQGNILATNQRRFATPEEIKAGVGDAYR